MFLQSKNCEQIKQILFKFCSKPIFFGLEGFWGKPQGPNFPSPQATMLALRLNCSTAALTTPQIVLSISKPIFFCQI